jgi:hypothetical protein
MTAAAARSILPRMTFLRFASAAARVSAAAAVVAAVACSNSPPALPQVYVMANVNPGSHPSNVCPILGSVSGWVTIGTTSASVADGDNQNGAAVGVNCTVKSNGDGTFNVTANAALAGPNGGSFFVSGPMFAGPPGTTMLSGIVGKFQRGDTGGGQPFVDTNCTVTFSGSQGVAAGRVWGNIECPNIVDMGQQVAPITTPPMYLTCDGQAEFRFENCAQ